MRTERKSARRTMRMLAQHAKLPIEHLAVVVFVHATDQGLIRARARQNALWHKTAEVGVVKGWAVKQIRCLKLRLAIEDPFQASHWSLLKRSCLNQLDACHC